MDCCPNAREALDKYETIIICLYLFSRLMLENHKTRIDTPKNPKQTKRLRSQQMRGWDTFE